MNTQNNLSVIVLASACFAYAGDAPQESETLWYRQPATVDSAVLPFAYAPNLPGKAAYNPMQFNAKKGTGRLDAWESQSLPAKSTNTALLGLSVFLDHCKHE